MADGILLERAGVPAVSICTDAFRVPAQAMAKAYGFPDFRFVTVPHPIASLDVDQIRDRVRDLLPAIVTILTAEEPS
ncbi:MAG TPA: hypothetical protein VHF06_22435 [Pseudonocardiaceae bacterium]|nr:hypothetical protein [Pseudonocardiaceae bacterium]